jgi:hypothetical protein
VFLLTSRIDLLYTNHKPELLFTHRLKLGFVHSPQLLRDVNRVFRSCTGCTDVRPIRFNLFTRFITVSITSTPVLPLRMPPPRRISCFETHVDHPQKWGFWIQHRRSAEKEPNRAEHLYIRLTGSRAVANRGAIACPWYQSLRNREGVIYWRIGVRYWLFLFVIGCFCIFVVPCSRLSLCLFWLYNFVFT